jgi:hypothetical protein
LNHSSVSVLRRDIETAVLKVPGDISGCGDLFVKVYELRTIKHRVTCALRMRRSGWHDLSVNRKLKALGIEVPEPVGACNDFSKVLAPWRSLFANRWLHDAVSIRDAVVQTRRQRKEGHVIGVEQCPDRTGRAITAEDFPVLCQTLGGFVRELHDKGIATSDLNAGNIMIRDPKQRSYPLLLVDYDRILFRRRIGRKLRLTNLAQIAAFMSAAAPDAVTDLSHGYLYAQEVAGNKAFIEALHHRTSDLKQKWKNREDENFAAIYRQLHKRS